MRIVIDLQGCQTASRFRGIGRYSLALVQAMARQAGEHELWLALNGRLADSIIDIRAAFNGLIPPERIRVFEVPGPTAEIDPANTRRARSAELIREQFLATLRPDIIYIPSLFEGLIDDAVTSVGRFTPGENCAVTLHDLIPLVHSQHYLADERYRNWYLRKLQSLKNAGLLLAVSEYSRREAIEVLGLPEDRVVSTSEGIDDRFRPLKISPEQEMVLRRRYSLTRKFVLYTGGIDYRKNIEGLIEAYALLPYSLRREHQLAIVGKSENPDRRRLQLLARRAGLQDGELVLTGFVPDEELVALYNLCALFVFPSLHEGFGLPPLEAMACGAPAIGSNATSIPEVIGWDEALFDPRDPKTMAAKMQQALTDEGFRAALRAHGLRQAKNFSWETSARRALEALEELHRRRTASSIHVICSSRRPRLAYISPLPPEKTGIADYSAELIPELARFYEIELISDQSQVSDPWLAANFPLRPVAYFEANRERYDRLLYHFGNSPFHAYMFGLLERHPGVVVLHDFFLSGVLNYLEDAGYLPGAFTRALYYSHGYTALLAEREKGREEAVWTYPCNLQVLQQATGILVHSNFAKELAEKWYGRGASSDWVVIPQLRAPKPKPGRLAARRKLGLGDDEFLVCSFGLLAPTKLNHRLLAAWLESFLSRDERCRLVFVGENHGGDYGGDLLEAIHKSNARERISITGFASPELYQAYLAAADAAVQLRARSRGETSRAILDCLAWGVPLIFNAHGSAAEIPDGVALKLPDDFSNDALREALEHIYQDKTLRRQLSHHAREYIRTVHHPARVAEQYREAIEAFATRNPGASYQQLLPVLADTTDRTVGDKEIVQLALSIAGNQPVLSPPRLFVDISVLVFQDLKTGIERVTRSILRFLLLEPPGGFRVEPVYEEQGNYRYARASTARIYGLKETGLPDEWVELRGGDLFLGLDWAPHQVLRSRTFFEKMRVLGIPVYFVVYDLLPILRPDCFPEGMKPLFANWLTAIAQQADGLICISRSVADEVLDWLEENRPARKCALKIGYFHLGADILNSLPTTGLAPESERVLELARTCPTILMVGTIEPRKGYTQALSAFEKLWQEGLQINLVIAGKQGWMVEQFIERLRAHPELNRRLFWLEGASDEILLRLYDSCTALLAASEGEGFGLPLVEAAQHGLPIIARDIPVFREVAGEHAFYFENARSPEALASALKEWFALYKAGKVPQSKDMPWLTWEQSTRRLVDVILGGHWYKVWEPSRKK